MRIKPVIILLVFLVGLYACKSKKMPGKKLANKRHLPTLIDQMESSELKVDWLSVKASVDFNRNDQKSGFKANIRMRTDSLIWISVTPLIGVELARVVLTPDSVKLINRVEGKYFVGDYKYLNRTFNAEFSYDLMQALLLGNSLNLEENEKLKASIDEGMYLVSGLKKRRLERSLEKEELRGKDDKVYSAWIDPITFKITKQSFANFHSDHYMQVNYSDFEDVDGQAFPHKTSVFLESKEKVTTNISYSNVYFNKPKKMPFSISSKYEPIIF